MTSSLIFSRCIRLTICFNTHLYRCGFFLGPATEQESENQQQNSEEVLAVHMNGVTLEEPAENSEKAGKKKKKKPKKKTDSNDQTPKGKQQTSPPSVAISELFPNGE